MLIVADGFIATSAFLAAYEIQPDILENALFSHSSDEKGHILMLKHLKGNPILHLQPAVRRRNRSRPGLSHYQVSIDLPQ
jgi:NaMN:DMB phosphoribosyltransferase